MTCPRCQHQNRPGAKFCGDCGATLLAACAQCGTELRPNAKFCDECGTPVTAAAAAAPKTVEASGARKTVSILFADLAGSTALHERLDPESARQFMESYYAVARKAVAGQGGKVTQFLGDGVLAMFGVPRVAEDDALRAVRAGVAMQQAFQALAAQRRDAIGATGLRVAINTGEVVVRGETDIIGDPVNVAARLQDRGSDGDVVIGESTQRLVASQVSLELLGHFDLKGRAEKVKAYRVLSLDAQPQAALAQFVGRELELKRLQAAYSQASETPATQLAVLLGSPGLGKSRLLAEFTQRTVAFSTVIAAHCDAAGGASFAPIADALRKHLKIEATASTDELLTLVEQAMPESDADRSRIAKGIVGILTRTPSAPEETFFVVRRFLAGLCASRPVVLIIDDLQWAEPLLFDLVEHLVQWGRNLPLLILIGARPELREVASTLTTPGGLVTDVLTLDGLDAGAAMKLAAAVIGADDLPAVVAVKVLATSEGNPLFISELVRMLVVEGALIREGDRWLVGDALATVAMPPTIHALLAARIERLEPLHCAILERAAVVGRQFSRSSVAALLNDDAKGVDAALESLQRAELIERDTGWLLGEPVLRFHHVLIRDAAYHRLLKGTRATLHEQLANWIEGRVGEATDHDEMIGRHLEDAHRLLGELGPLDEAAQSLGERAASRLAAAGRRALQADDVELAAGLLGRAAKRLRVDDDDRPALIIDWSEALLSAGDVNQAAQAIQELDELVKDSERLRSWHNCLKGHHTVLTAPRNLEGTVTAVAAAASSLTALEDAAGEAKAHFVHALALSRQGQVGACEAALDRALAAARKAQDRRQANAVLAIAPLAALWGPSPVTRASGRCLDVVRVLRITQGAPAVESVALSCQGVLEALRGRTEAAHRMIASGREMVEELGISQHLHEADVYAGYVSMLEQEWSLAESRLRSAYEGLRDLGLGINAARAAALLAKVLLAQGEIEQAKALSQESEQLAGDDLKAAIAWRGVRAEALAKGGEHDDAIKLARKAVNLAEKTDALLDHADARRALAIALREAGQTQEADAEEKRAQQLWEAKGATLLLEQEITDRQRVSEEKSPVSVIPTPSKVGGFSRTLGPGVKHDQFSTAGSEFQGAVEQRNYTRLRNIFHDDFLELDHSTGSTWGADGAFGSIKRLLESENPHYRVEVLAFLGSRQELIKRHTGASGATGKNYDVGPYESTRYQITEIDKNKFCSVESFAEDKLGDAVVRLYERYAETLQDSDSRQRALHIAGWWNSANGPIDFDRWTASISADIQAIDHRTVGFGTLSGAEAVKHATSVLINELSEDVVFGYADIGAIAPDAALLLSASTGTDRASGGTWERRVWELCRFDDAGQVKHWERFDEDKADAARARFEELTDSSQPEPTNSPITTQSNRRVTENTMAVLMRRVFEAGKAQDWVAIRSQLGKEYREHHYPTGSTFGVDEHIASLQRLYKSQDPYYEHELIATLGDALALAWMKAGASGSAGQRYDVGPYEQCFYVLQGFDSAGNNEGEVFAENKLGDAVARLYERYAESLPEGQARDRALMTAHCAEWFLTDSKTYVIEDVVYPDAKGVDHRLAGHEEVEQYAKRYVESWQGLSRDRTFRINDVLALNKNGLLRVVSERGTWQKTGGTFENEMLLLGVMGPDGRGNRAEFFELNQVDKALARFQELTAETQPEHDQIGITLRPGVKPNAATAFMQDFVRALQQRDFDSLRSMFVESYREIGHPTGSTIDKAGTIASLERLFNSEEPYYRIEVLATLGEALQLGKHVFGASAASSKNFDVGAYENVRIQIDDLAEGCEVFDEQHLADAIARLYERYAESLPAGPEQKTALAMSAFVEFGLAWDLDGVATLLAADIQYVDHRHAGVGALDNADAVVNVGRVMKEELTNTLQVRIEDVLRILPNACLWYYVDSGTAERSGGDFERHIWDVVVFNNDGLISHWERFELEHRDQAIARFEELTAAATPTARKPPNNRASRQWSRAVAALNSQDWKAGRGFLHDDFIEHHHPTGLKMSADQITASMKAFYRSSVAANFHSEPVAILGDSLVLSCIRASAIESKGGNFDVGAFENNLYHLLETDENGLIIRIEDFAENKLGEAIARLYERYVELLTEGKEKQRAEQVAVSVRAMLTFFDMDVVGPRLATDIVFIDNRLMGSWHGTGKDEAVKHIRGLNEVANNIQVDDKDVLATEPNLLLVQRMTAGIERVGGGDYERPFLILMGSNEDGLMDRWEFFDVGDEAKALARFEELTSEAQGEPENSLGINRSKRRITLNTALKVMNRSAQAIVAQDWSALRACLRDDYREHHYPTGSTFGADEHVASFERLYRSDNPYFQGEAIAALGQSLGLCLINFGASGATGSRYPVGAYENSFYILQGVDTEERYFEGEVFAENKLGDALARLYERYAESLPEGPQRQRALATARAVTLTLTKTTGQTREEGESSSVPGLQDSLRHEAIVPGAPGIDHRLTGHTGKLDDFDLRQEAAIRELASDADFEIIDVLAASSEALLRHTIYRGHWKDGGGEYEVGVYVLSIFGPDGRQAQFEVFEAGQEDKALARFDELQGDDANKPATESSQDKNTAFFNNAASNAHVAFTQLYMDKAWDSAPLLLAEDVRISDHRRLLQVEIQGRQKYLDYFRALGDLPNTKVTPRLLATRGQRLALSHDTLVVSGGDVGESEVHILDLFCLNEAGLIDHCIRYSPEDIHAAYAELDALYEASEESQSKHAYMALSPFRKALSAFQWDVLPTMFADDFISNDNRKLSLIGPKRGAQEWIEANRSLLELAPDTQYRCHHFLSGARGAYIHGGWYGTRDGGAFEMEINVLVEFDEQGKIVQLDNYDDASVFSSKRWIALGIEK